MPESPPKTPTIRRSLFPGAPPLPQAAPLPKEPLSPEPIMKKGTPGELKAEALKALETAITPPAPPQPEQTESAKLKKPKIPEIPGMPKISKKPIMPKALANAEQAQKEETILIKPKIDTGKLTLKLNPEDFMIKQRPKTITSVPKDARLKLKTSPFAPVSNPAEVSQPKGPFPPTQLIKPKGPINASIPKIASPVPDPSPPPIPTPQPTAQIPIPAPQPIVSPKIIAPVPASFASETAPDVLQAQQAQQTQNLKQTIMDLKIKKANLQKLSLEFEMQELTGEISSEELEQKKTRMNGLVQKIDQQIQELEKML